MWPCAGFFTSKQVAVEGHTDNVGTLGANQQISNACAKVVLAILLAYGVPAERLKAEGFAYQRPVVSNWIRAWSKRFNTLPVTSQ